MAFVVNEQGVQRLIQEMWNDIRSLRAEIGEIESQSTQLRSALGEDAASVEASVQKMYVYLADACDQLTALTKQMEDYISRVQEIRLTLQDIN